MSLERDLDLVLERGRSGWFPAAAAATTGAITGSFGVFDRTGVSDLRGSGVLTILTSLLGLLSARDLGFGVGSFRLLKSSPTPISGSKCLLSSGGSTSSSLLIDTRDLSRDLALVGFRCSCWGVSFVIGGNTGVCRLDSIAFDSGFSCLDGVRLFCSGFGVADLIGGKGGVADFLLDGPGSWLRTEFILRLESCFLTCNNGIKK